MQKHTKVGLIAGTLALFAGVGIGTTSQPEPEVVTKTKEVPVEVVKEKKVEVPTASQDCLDALDAADQVQMTSAEAFDLAARGFTAASEFDVAALDQVNAELEALGPGFEEEIMEYTMLAEACRSQKDA